MDEELFRCNTVEQDVLDEVIFDIDIKDSIKKIMQFNDDFRINSQTIFNTRCIYAQVAYTSGSDHSKHTREGARFHIQKLHIIVFERSGSK